MFYNEVATRSTVLYVSEGYKLNLNVLDDLIEGLNRFGTSSLGRI